MVDQERDDMAQQYDGEAPGRDWARQHAVTIGQSVARVRAERKLSAQKLAEKCAKIGMPSLTRTVITKLENGRKEAVSTAELAVLGKALGIPPAMLMYPLGIQQTVEVVPGQELETLEAFYWLSGLSADSYGEAIVKGSALDLFIMHARIVDALLRQQDIWGTYRHTQPQPILPLRVTEVTWEDIGEPGMPPLPGEIQAAREMQSNASYLRTTRKAIRDLGLTPPLLPPELADIDREEADDGPR
jgi:transcriptional regulator with XRE-family HTH domain